MTHRPNTQTASIECAGFTKSWINTTASSHQHLASKPSACSSYKRRSPDARPPPPGVQEPAVDVIAVTTFTRSRQPRELMLLSHTDMKLFFAPAVVLTGPITLSVWRHICDWGLSSKSDLCRADEAFGFGVWGLNDKFYCVKSFLKMWHQGGITGTGSDKGESFVIDTPASAPMVLLLY